MSALQWHHAVIVKCSKCVGIFGTSLKSSTSKGAVRNSLRAKLVRVLPKSATSDRELATLQSTHKVPSTATVRGGGGGGGDSREDGSRGANRKHEPTPENAASFVTFPPLMPLLSIPQYVWLQLMDHVTKRLPQSRFEHGECRHLLPLSESVSGYCT